MTLHATRRNGVRGTPAHQGINRANKEQTYHSYGDRAERALRDEWYVPKKSKHTSLSSRLLVRTTIRCDVPQDAKEKAQVPHHKKLVVCIQYDVYLHDAVGGHHHVVLGQESGVLLAVAAVVGVDRQLAPAETLRLLAFISFNHSSVQYHGDRGNGTMNHVFQHYWRKRQNSHLIFRSCSLNRGASRIGWVGEEVRRESCTKHNRGETLRQKTSDERALDTHCYKN